MRVAMGEQSRDYTVGYGKPPVENRFQKGQSGNPGGRRRGTKTLRHCWARRCRGGPGIRIRTARG